MISKVLSYEVGNFQVFRTITVPGSPIRILHHLEPFIFDTLQEAQDFVSSDRSKLGEGVYAITNTVMYIYVEEEDEE